VDVTPIVTRLRAQLTGFPVIAASADADAAIDTAPATPAAYVVPLAETAEAPDLVGVHHQRLLQEFGVVLVVANLRDATGLAAAAELQTRRLAVRAALLGWAPDASNGEPVAFTSGAILQFKDSRLWWRDVFRVFADFRSP
jgi:hypothetical protein